MKSENLNELFAALAKAQAEMPIAELAANNPFFKSKYADFTTIVKASRPSLSKHGLSVTQVVRNNCLLTILGHSSGQYIESEMEIRPQKQDVQSFGSYISYLKRYSYAAIVGITSGEEDDDGESAMQRPAQKEYLRSGELASNDDVRMLENACRDRDDLKDAVLKRLKIDNFYALDKNKVDSVINWVNEKKIELDKIGK